MIVSRNEVWPTPPKHAIPNTCYQISSLRVKPFGRNQGVTKTWRTMDPPPGEKGTWMTRRNMLLPTLCGSVAEWLGRWTCDQ